MMVPSGNGSFPSREALIATSLPRMARRSLRLPSSCATEINLQSRYPGGILTPKSGAASSSTSPRRERREGDNAGHQDQRNEQVNDPSHKGQIRRMRASDPTDVILSRR